MVKTSQPPALEARQRAQGARLRHVRRALGLTQTAAADIAGVSIFKWHRMELGHHPIDPLALQIFCEAHKIGADYVITAKLSGLSEDLARKLVAMQLEDQEQPPSNRSRRAAASAAGNRPVSVA
jgi:transcriptional regulator with XRE-family HTH domain